MNNKIPNEFTKVSATLSHQENNEITNILDGNLETIYASSGKYGAGSYADIYFTFSSHKAIEGVEFYTSNNKGWGLVQRYEILYRNNISTSDWVSVHGITDAEKNIGWRTAQFQPVFAKEICIRVHASNGGFVTINEAKVHQNLKFDMDMQTLIEQIDDKLYLPNYLDLVLINEIATELSENKEAQKIIEVIKYNFLSKHDINETKDSFIKKTSVNVKEFCETLKIKETEELNSLNLFVQGNQNILLISNKDCEVLLLEHKDQPTYSKTLKIKNGLNTIYIPNSGELFSLGNNQGEIIFKTYGASETSIFKMGESKFSQFLSAQGDRSHIFVEGKNFIANMKKEWITTNFDEHRFLDSILTLDTYFDYLYNLLDMSLFYEKNRVKRLLWQGTSEVGSNANSSEIGSYLTFGGDASLFFQKGIHNLANSTLFTLTSEEMVSDKFFPNELADILKIGFSKTFELKYNKNLILTEDIKKDTFIKLLMYSNSDRFMTRLFRKYYTHEFQPNEKPMDMLALWMSELLFRNIGSLFSQMDYEISQDILDKCSIYPNLFLNIDEITSENYKEFSRREIELFNQSYLQKIQLEGRI